MDLYPREGQQTEITRKQQQQQQQQQNRQQARKTVSHRPVRGMTKTKTKQKKDRSLQGSKTSPSSLMISPPRQKATAVSGKALGWLVRFPVSALLFLQKVVVLGTLLCDFVSQSKTVIGSHRCLS